MTPSLDAMTDNNSTQVSCVQCGTECDFHRTYCGGCGGKLWEPCLRCETKNSIAEKFCSQCGENLTELLRGSLDELGNRLQQATKLEQEGQLLAAITCLEEAEVSEHSEMANLADEIEQRREKINTLRNQAIVHAQTAQQETEQLVAKCQYAQAYKELMRVPDSLRSQPMRQMLEKIEKILVEIYQLRHKIQLALKTHRIDGLLPKVNRLLELQPHQEDIQRLRQQLQVKLHRQEAALANQLLEKASEALKENKYRRAGQYLKKVPDSALKSIHSQTLHTMKECIWLAEQLRVAPQADPVLLMIAARLKKLQPHDIRTKGIYQEIQKRLDRAKAKTNQERAPWVEPNKSQSKSMTIEPIGSLQTLTCHPSAIDVDPWIKSPEQYLVACGLAIQGLGAAQIDIDLKPPGDISLRNRLRKSARRRSAKEAWGIDLGLNGLKYVHLVRPDKGGSITIRCVGLIPYDLDIHPQSIQDVQPAFVGALRRWCKEVSPGNNPIVASFCGIQTLGRFFSMPRMKSSKLIKAIEYEVHNQIPLPITEVSYGYHTWQPPPGDKTEPPEMASMLIAAKNQHVELRCMPFQEGEVQITAIQSECVALMNYMIWTLEERLKERNASQAIAMVEIGATSTHVVVLSAHGGWFRSIHKGANALNQPLVKKFGLTHGKAENLRAHPEKAKWMYLIDRELMPCFQELVQSIENALQDYEKSTKKKVERIYVAGGGSLQYGMLRELHRMNGIGT